MPSRAQLAAIGLFVCSCGSTLSDDVIYYDPALRPGVVAASDVERQLLSRLAEAEPGQEVQVGEQVFVPEPHYYAASGRRCRSVRVRGAGGEQARLACESDDGWVFVPDVFGAEEQGL